jgi:hypothetical protein
MSEKEAVTESMRKEYRRATKKERGVMLDTLVRVTGYNRSYAARKLRSAKTKQTRVQNRTARNRGRKKTYGDELLKPLLTLWYCMDFACGKRLRAGMRDVIDALSRHGAFACSKEAEGHLLSMSASTIDRLLRAERKKYELRGRSMTKPGTLLKSQIPIRRGDEWDDARPGFVEIDLVAHCGTDGGGEFINTLDVTDVATGWCETQAVLNKAQRRVFEALKEIRGRLPFPLLGIDSDNGSEFINHELKRWCDAENLVFTRSRPNKKNDGCHVEQKNWSVVRQTVGYGRYEGEEALGLMNELYAILRLRTNFFMPSVKLESKERVGAQVRKRYSEPMTPYRRALASDDVSPDAKARLTKQFVALNPLTLLREIQRLREALGTLKC